MKALTITNESVTREALLEMAEEIQGAWVGYVSLPSFSFWKAGNHPRLPDCSV